MEEEFTIIERIKNLDIDVHSLLSGAIATLIICALAFVLWGLISRALKTLSSRAHISNQTILPIRLVLRYGIVLAAIVLSISSFGIPIGNFWTFLSTVLGLVAIGFVAVWSVLSNISSTFFLIGFKPFRVGDYVVIVGDDVNGRVIDINFMFTTLRKKNGDQFTIPNNQFFQKATLRPGDFGKSLEDPERSDGSDTHKAKTPDHSQQNLEGIPLDPNSRNK